MDHNLSKITYCQQEIGLKTKKEEPKTKLLSSGYGFLTIQSIYDCNKAFT